MYNGFGDDAEADDDAGSAAPPPPPTPAGAPTPAPPAATAASKSKGFRRKPSVYLGFDAGAVDADADADELIVEAEFEEAEYSLAEDVALQCVDCLESKVDGTVDDVDGSWHCAACIAERDEGSLASGDGGDTSSGGGGGGSAADVEGYEVIDPDEEEEGDRLRRSSVADTGQRQHSLDVAAEEAAAIAAEVLTGGRRPSAQPTAAQQQVTLDQEAAAQAEMESAEADAKADESAVFKTGVRFLGIVAVLEDEGVPVCNAAVDDLKAIITKNGGVVVRGTLCLSPTSIEIQEEPDGFGHQHVLHTINPAAITFSYMTPGGILSIIVRDSHSRAMLCTCISIAARSAAADVMTTLEFIGKAANRVEEAKASFRRAKISKESYRLPRSKSRKLKSHPGSSTSIITPLPAKQSAAKALGKELTLGKGAALTAAAVTLDPTAVDKQVPIGTSTCIHFTSMTVNMQQGIETAKSALAEAVGEGEVVGTDAVVVVSLQGLKVVDVRSFEVLADVAIKDITFGGKLTEESDLRVLQSECPDSWKRPICVIIHTNATLAMNTAELLQFGAEFGIGRIREGIKVAKLAYMKELKKHKASLKGKGASPFAPTTEPEPDLIPQSLVKSQISRRTLKAIRVLGNGQFGEVWLATQTRLKPGSKTAENPAGKVQNRHVLD